MEKNQQLPADIQRLEPISRVLWALFLSLAVVLAFVTLSGCAATGAGSAGAGENPASLGNALGLVGSKLGAEAEPSGFAALKLTLASTALSMCVVGIGILIFGDRTLGLRLLLVGAGSLVLSLVFVYYGRSLATVGFIAVLLVAVAGVLWLAWYALRNRSVLFELVRKGAVKSQAEMPPVSAATSSVMEKLRERFAE